MPVYHNSNTDAKFVGPHRIEGGCDLSLNEWYSDLPTGVTITNNLPSYNPVFYSGYIEANGNVSVPAVVTSAYKIRVWVEAGLVQLRFNYDASTPPIVLGEGQEWDVICISRLIDNLRFTFVSPGRVWINILKG